MKHHRPVYSVKVKKIWWIGWSILFVFISCRIKQPQPTFHQSAGRSEKLGYDNLFIEGCKEKILGNYERAFSLFMECYKINPKEAAPLYEIAYLYYRQNDFSHARIFIEKALDLDPRHFWYNYLYANVLKELRQYEKAVAIYESLYRESPQKRELLYEIAEIYTVAKQYAKAIETYNKIETIIGPDEELYIARKNLYLMQNNIEAATGEIKKIIANYPDDPRFVLYLAEIFLANNYEDSALFYYRRLEKQYPDDPMVLLSIADFYCRRRNKESCFDYLQKIFSNAQVDIDSKMNVLLSLYNQYPRDTAMIRKAYLLIDVMQEIHPAEAKAYTIKGDFLLRDDRKEEALREYIKAKNLDNSRFAIWNEIILIELDLGLYDSLIKHAAEALEIFPEQGIFYFARGYGLMNRKRWEEAETLLQQALTFVGGQQEIKFQILFYLGEVSYQLKKYAACFDYFEKARAIFPEDPLLLNNYAYYLSLQGHNLELAADMASRVVKKFPGVPSYLDTYGWVLYKQAKYADAQKWLEKAVEKGGANNGTILDHLGDAYYKMGQIDRAVEYWQKAKEKGCENEWLDKKITDRTLYE